MLPIYLVLVTVVLYSVASIIRKKISAVDDNLNYIFSVLFQILGGLFVFIFSFALGFSEEYVGYFTQITPYLAVKILLSSALWFFATVTSFKALNSITASKYSIIEALSPLISIVLAILFLGERFSRQQTMGMILILVSVFAVIYDKNEKLSRFSKGELIAVASAFLSGIALVNDKGIYTALPLSPTLTALFILPGLFGLLFKPTEFKKIKKVLLNKKIIKQLIVMSAIWGLAAISYYKAIVLSNSISLVVSLSQLTVIFTVFLGLIFLKEVENWKIKILAAVMSVAGLIFMSI